MSEDFEKNNSCECVGEDMLSRLKEYANSGCIAFHMPGHKRADFQFLNGVEKIDITEIDGFDNLHDAKGIIMDAQVNASKVFGVKHTRFLVGGSTCGILAGIRSVCKVGDDILIARNCHKSVYNAVELCSLNVHYIYPAQHNGICADIDVNAVKVAFDECPNIKLVVITSPTYEGVISDIQAIAQVCHEHGALLFVDEAHGAHLGFCNFEKSARNLGADIVVNSVHKTLPSLTQTALLHVCSERVNILQIDKNLAVFQSSSPSYILMSSIDSCVRCIASGNLLKEWSDAIDVARERLCVLKNISILDGKSENCFAYDKSKFVFVLNKCNISGVELADILREKYHIEVEMASANHIIAMTGAGDTMESLNTLVLAMKEIDDSTVSQYDDRQNSLIQIAQKVFEPYEIAQLNTCFVDIDKSVGSVSAENIWAYPPGSPLIVKGERIEKEVVMSIKNLKNIGVNILSEYRQFPQAILIVEQ